MATSALSLWIEKKDSPSDQPRGSVTRRDPISTAPWPYAISNPVRAESRGRRPLMLKPASSRLAHLLARRRRRCRLVLLRQNPIRPEPNGPLRHRQQQRLKHRYALLELAVGGWRAIGPVADDHRRCRPGQPGGLAGDDQSIHAVGLEQGFDRLDLDVGLQGKGCDHVDVLTPHRKPVDD